MFLLTTFYPFLLLIITAISLILAVYVLRYRHSRETAFLNTMIGKINDVVIILDSSHHIICLNPAAEKLIDHPVTEVTGQSAQLIFAAWPELVKLFQDTGTITVEAGFEYPQKEIGINYTIYPVHDRRNHLIGRIIIGCDISIKKSIETLSRKTEENTTQYRELESNGLLIGKIAHDFNNLLSGMLANLQLIKIKLDKGLDITQYLAKIETMIMNATGLTKQLSANATEDSPVTKE